MNGRIAELDYIKGIAMLMVVMGHLLDFSLNVKGAMQDLFLFQMPLFFVVSGFLSYREKQEDLRERVRRFGLRSRALLVPLVVWSLMLNFVENKIIYSISDIYRGGYWFFLALWWCDLLNTITDYISKRWNLGIFPDVVIYGGIWGMTIIARLLHLDVDVWLPLMNIQYQFPFFALGVLMRKYPQLQVIVLNKYTYALGLVLLMVGWKWDEMQMYLIWTMATFGGLVVTWMICRSIDNESMIAKCLSLVGQNTLPIYAIHYLFITNLSIDLSPILNHHQGFFLQVVISFVYAACVIIACLVVDRILSLNPITRLVFFGESKKREWKFKL